MLDNVQQLAISPFWSGIKKNRIRNAGLLLISYPSHFHDCQTNVIIFRITIDAKKILSDFEPFNNFGIVEYNIWLMILRTIRLKTPQDQSQFTHSPTLP